MVEKLSKDVKDLRDWLQTQARENQLSYLLAFADDGAIWGWFDGNQLALAPEACAPLRIETIQRIHLFSQDGELRIARPLGWKILNGKNPTGWMNATCSGVKANQLAIISP
jgi:hypothetical protein